MVRITNPFNLKDFGDDKLSVVDVNATDVTRATYTMEAQATYHEAFASRTLYYWAEVRTYHTAPTGTCRLRLPVVGINVMDFRLFPEGAAAPMHTSFTPYCRAAPELDPLSAMHPGQAEKRYNEFVADASCGTGSKRGTSFAAPIFSCCMTRKRKASSKAGPTSAGRPRGS